MAALERWSDERLDDRFNEVDRRITYVNGLPVKVAELSEQLRGIQHELTHEQGAVPTLIRKMEEMNESPSARRQRMAGFVHSAIGGLVGVAGGVALAVLTGLR